MSKFQAGRPKIGAEQLYKGQPEQARTNLLRSLQERLDQGRPAADFTKKYGAQFADPNRKPYDYTAPGPNIPLAPTGRMTKKGAAMNPFSEGSIESRVKQTKLDNEARIRANLNPRLTREEAREWLELAKIKEEKTWEAKLANERERSRIPGMFEAEGAESIFAIQAANMGGRGPFQSKTERDAWINKQGKWADTFRKMAKDYDKMQKKIKKHGKLSGLQVVKTRSPLMEYLRNDGMGEQSKRGWLMSHALLTSITPSMIDDLNFQQITRYARKDDKSFKLDKEGKRIPVRRFRDEAGNLAKLDPETSPVGTTTKRTYLTAGQAIDFFRFQIIQAVEEGQYTSMDARTLLNKLDESMLEKGQLTEKGRAQLINYFADLEGLGIDEATRIVDDTVDYLTAGKLATAEKTKLINEKTKLQNLLDIIDKKKRVPSNMTLTNNGQLMWEKDGQGYMVTRDEIVKSLNEINKDLSPESLKKIQKSFTTLDETILKTLDFKKDEETGKISIDETGRNKGQVRSIELKLKEIIERRDKAIEEGKSPSPLPAMLILEALHPTHTYNPYSTKSILLNPEGFDAGVIGENPFIGHNKGPSMEKMDNISKLPKIERMMIDPMFGVIANAVFEKYLLQTQFVPTAGEAHPAVEAIVKRGILPSRKPKGTDENKLTDTSEKEGMETPPQNEVWVPKLDKDGEPVQRSDGSIVMLYGGVTRLAGSATIGREAFKEWKRWQNHTMGRPTDAYDENSVSNSEYEVIGTFIRELYQRTNPDLYKVERLNGKQYYKLTDTGLRALQQAADAAPNAFKAREVKGRTVSRNVVEFETKGKREVTTVVHTGQIAQQEEARQNFQSVAMKIDTLRNKLAYQVAAPALVAAKNQVTLDPLGDFFDIGPEKFDEFRGTFKRKVAEVRRENPDMSIKDAENLVWSREGENYRPEYEMDKQITRFLEFLNTVGRDSDQAMYLDVVIQKLTGRMHVAQTRFNPQLKPWMRYVIGGVLHSEFHPNKPSEEHGIFKEEMAKRFIRGAKDLLPKERIARFDEEIESYLVNKDPNSLFAQIYNEGAAVEASLISDEDLKTYNKEFSKVGLATQPTRFEEGTKDAKLDRAAQMSKGLSQGSVKTGFDAIMEEEGVGPEYISVPESIGSIPRLDIPESLMARTRGGNNKSEGIEGLQIIEGAIEFKRYMDARNAYKPFRTNLQVEYDGKTHGPSSMLALVGALKAAYRIGLLRKPNQPLKLGPIDAKDLVDMDPDADAVYVDEVAGDLRDAMGAFMLENKDAYAENYTGISGLKNNLNATLSNMIEAAVRDREHYLKKPPMVLTYGRLLKNLKEEIFEVIFVGESTEQISKLKEDKEFMAAFEKNKKDPNQNVDGYITDFLHTILADAIDTQLHPAVIEFGQLMRANALVAALTDEVMVVKNASGIDQYVGARETVVKRDQDGEVIEGDIFVESGGGKAGNVSANYVLGKSRPAGSAMKNGIPGGHGRGRGVPAVAQGIDGDWMMRLYSGKSWEILSDIPNFWLLGVFDAGVTNISSAAEVRRQANKAWKTSVKEFYPWKHTLVVQPKQSFAKLYKRLGFDPQEKKWISEDHANMKIPFIDFREKYGNWPNNVVAPNKSDPSTLPTQVYYQGGGRDRREIGKFASDLEGPYKLYYYLLHDTSPGESEGDLSLKSLYRAIDDAMIQRGKHGFRPRKGLIKDEDGKVIQKPESYTDYEKEKQKHVKKVVHAMIRMIDQNVPEKQKLNLEAKLLTKDPVTTPLEGMTRKQIKNFADAIQWGLDIYANNEFYDRTLTKSHDYLFNEVEKKGDETLQID